MLGDAFSRLIFYYLFLTRTRRASLAVENSSCTWQLDSSLLRHARAIADEMEKAGRRTSKYYSLSEDPLLEEWVQMNVRPVIRSYVGSAAVAPHAHVRVVSTEAYQHTWQHMYAEHAFGYYHWDELCYSIPLIVYLDDVSATDGPYSYVEGSDKLRQNLTIRAFTQAISCKLLVTDNIDEAHKRRIAALPRIFRGGEMVGSHLDPKLFDDSLVRKMTGPAGTAILSHGFSLVHGGGHPSAGRRRALFIAHRYPRKRLLDLCAAVGARWWRLRTERPGTAAGGAPRKAHS